VLYFLSKAFPIIASYGEYGAQGWLNAGAKANPAQYKFEKLPNDMYLMD
jgi:hypothetical protein